MKILTVTSAMFTAALLSAAPLGAVAATAQEKAACYRQHGNLMGKQSAANIESCWRVHGHSRPTAAPQGADTATTQMKLACFRQHGNLMGKQSAVNIESCWRVHGQMMAN